MTIAELLEDFEINYMDTRLKPTTIDGYRTNISHHIIPYLGLKEVNAITYSDIDSLTHLLMDKGLSNTSVIYVLATLRKALNYAVKREYALKNIIMSYDFPRKNKYHYSLLNEKQLETLLLGINLEEDIYPATLLASCYGLRRGETLGLKICDISDNQISIVRTATHLNHKRVVTDCKTEDSQRIILITEKHAELLRCYNILRKPNKYGYLLRNKDGIEITSCTLNVRFTNYLKKLKLPIVRFHDLRHSYATIMLRHNINPKIVCEVLGHSDVSVTLNLYSHPDIMMQRICLDVIEGIF